MLEVSGSLPIFRLLTGIKQEVLDENGRNH